MINHGADRLKPHILHRSSLHTFEDKHMQNISNGTVYFDNDEGDTAPIAANALMKPEWDAIKQHRAEMCVKMLKKHGIKFTDNKDKCLTFMDKQCKVKSKTGICDEWYDALDKLKKGPASIIVAAPAPALAGSPMPAYAMDENAKLPEQGYEGELVAHDNMVTHTADWQREYGPHAGHATFQAICAEYPDNKWCQLRGYHVKKPTKSGSPPLWCALAFLAAAFGLLQS